MSTEELAELAERILAAESLGRCLTQREVVLALSALIRRLRVIGKGRV